MSGHSKWATIKHKKGAQDKARGKLFAKLIRQVEVAAREGGGDPADNPTLRTMFQKARDAALATSRASSTRASTTRATRPRAWRCTSSALRTTATAPAPRSATSSPRAA